MNTNDDKKMVIQRNSTKDYWCNEHGWVSGVENATQFTENELLSKFLPQGGEVKEYDEYADKRAISKILEGILTWICSTDDSSRENECAQDMENQGIMTKDEFHEWIAHVDIEAELI